MTPQDTTTPPLGNVSNPAAFGVEWTEPSGTRCQLYTLRGTTTLHLGMRYHGEWNTITVTEPSRFGLTEPVKTMKEFMVIVTNWFAAANKGEKR